MKLKIYMLFMALVMIVMNPAKVWGLLSNAYSMANTMMAPDDDGCTHEETYYEYVGDNQHQLTCSDCLDPLRDYEDCEFDETGECQICYHVCDHDNEEIRYIGNDQHCYYCPDCKSYTDEPEDCDYDDGVCMTCDHVQGSDPSDPSLFPALSVGDNTVHIYVSTDSNDPKFFYSFTPEEDCKYTFTFSYNGEPLVVSYCFGVEASYDSDEDDCQFTTPILSTETRYRLYVALDEDDGECEGAIINIQKYKHSHPLTAIAAADATCTATGNLAYWYCSTCEKYFSDADGATETTLADVTTAMTAHDYVNGECSVCHVYEPATQVTAENYASLGFTADNYSTYVDYYAIGTAKQLAWFRDFVHTSVTEGETSTYPNQSAKAVLTADIDLSTLEGNWIPIGTEAGPFKGIFDGQGHSITGQSILNYTTSYQGLFGHVEGTYKTPHAVLKNFSVSGTMTSSTSGLSMIAGVVGYSDYCVDIADVTNNVNITLAPGTTQSNIGGVAGACSRTNMQRCVNNGNIDAGASTERIGGLQAHSWGYTSANYCLNTGNITSTADNAHIGGIFGYQDSENRFQGAHHCLNTGTVKGGTANTYAGAIYGYYNKNANNKGENNYYLSTSTTKAVGANESTDDLTDVCTAIPADQVASGEVCYKLNGSTSTGTLNWYQTLDTDATPLPKTTGSTVYQVDCTYCNGTAGKAYSNTTEAVTGLHFLTAHPAEPANCTTAGNSAYWTCSLCNKVFSDDKGKNETTVADQTIPATGHSFENGVCTVCHLDMSKVLCFTAEEDNASVTLAQVYWPAPISLIYSTDNGATWSDYTIDTEIKLTHTGDKLYLCAKDVNETFNTGYDEEDFYYFVINKKVAASGDITSLLNSHGTLAVPVRAFSGLFDGCSSLTTAPELPATTLAYGCYACMFSGCSSLTTAPDLPATTLADACYHYMFFGCSSLTTAPDLPATTLADYCYCNMFYGCSSLSDVTVNFTDWNTGRYSALGWLKNVASTGTFRCPEGLDATALDEDYNHYVPEGWTVKRLCAGAHTLVHHEAKDATCVEAGNAEYWECQQCGLCFTDAEGKNRTTLQAVTIPATGQHNIVNGVCTVCHLDMSKVLCFTAEEDNASVTLKKEGTPAAISLIYSTDGGATWSEYSVGTDIPLVHTGDKLYLCAKDVNVTFSDPNSYYYFALNKKISASGDITTLLNSQGTLSVPGYAFLSLFAGCSSLTTAPDLPATSLADYCYYYMFYGCSSLTTAPDLPATTLADGCYGHMFFGCRSLATAPELSATTLASDCYYEMFSGCSSLTTAPDLPATTLADDCYDAMFAGCVSLTIAPDLPATTLADRCYAAMFAACSSLTTAPDLPATTLADYCYYDMFSYCSSLSSVTVNFTDWNTEGSSAKSWLGGVASTGTFICPEGLDVTATDNRGNRYVPEGWTVKRLTKGDVNVDGEKSIADIPALIGILSGRTTDAFGTADVDGNGNINIFDVKTLSNELLGKADSTIQPSDLGLQDGEFVVSAGQKANWTSGDAIVINGATYTTALSGDQSIFAPTADAAVADAQGKFKAIYPATLSNYELPATQTYIAGQCSAPMYAESTGIELVFRNLCAVLAIKVTSADIATLKSIRVKSDKAMYGAFSVAEATAGQGDYRAVLTNPDDDTKRTVTLVCPEALTLDAEGTTFYIAIPAQEYQHLTIYLSADGSTYKEAMATQVAEGLGTIACSNRDIDYQKNAVQLWANGPYFATMNVGSTATDYANATECSTDNVGCYYYRGGSIAFPSSTLEDDCCYDNDNLNPEHDTATKLWGSAWRMPSKAELQALGEGVTDLSTNNQNVKGTNTTWSWCDGTDAQYVTGCTLAGYQIVGNGNSIFLPAAGYYMGTDYYNIDSYGPYGRYWSSTFDSISIVDRIPCANALYFRPGNMEVEKLSVFGKKNSVRAVLAE